MASEDNPANSGLKRSNPLYEAATGKEGTGDQAGDGKYVDDNDDSGGSSSSGGSGGGGSAVDVGSGDSIDDADSVESSSGGGGSGSSGSSGSSSSSSGSSSSSSSDSGSDTVSGGTDDPDFSGGDSAVDVGSGDSIEDADSKSANSDPPETGDSGDETLESAESAGGATDEPAFSTVEGDPETETVVDNRAVNKEAARDLRLDAISNLNERTGNEGQAFERDDIELETTQKDGQRIVEAQLTDSGQDKLAEERDRIAEDELFSSVQQQTQADLDRGDVRIDEQDGEFTAELTDAGKIEEAAAASDEFGEDDLLVDSSGDVFVSLEARKERIAADNPGVQPDDITIQETRGSDGDIESDVSLDAEASARQSSGDGDVFSGAVSGIESGLSEVAQVASGDDDTTVEFRGDGSVINQARESQAGASDDQFGDTDLTLPFTDIEVGATAAAGAQAFDERIATPAGQVAGDVADVSQSGIENSVALFSGQTDNFDADSQADIERVQDIGRGEDADVSSERGLERFTEGAATGAVNVANVPAVANTGIEAGEFAIEGAEQTAAGRGGEFAATAAGGGVLLGARAAKAAKENPVSFGGQVVGSTAASAAAISTAGRVAGSGGARATSAAIQPGEELALAAARRARRRSGSSRFTDFLEDDSGPRTSVRTVGQRPQDPGLSTSGDSGGRLDNLRTFFGDDRGMADPTAVTTTRSRTTSETETADAPAEAQLPPRQAFSSDEEYARAIARARAKDDLPPAEEFPTREEFASELDQRARQVADDDIFEQDAQTSVETTSETDLAAETDTKFGRPGRGQQATATASTALRLETDVATAAFANGAIAEEATADLAADTAREAFATPDLALDTDQRFGSQTITETATEEATATATRQDLETETQQDLDIDTRTRTRTRTRTDLLGDSRSEVKSDIFLEDDGDLTTGVGAGGDTGTKRFEYGIATPEEVLEGGDDIGL